MPIKNLILNGITYDVSEEIKENIDDLSLTAFKNLVTEVIGGQYPDYNSSGVHISTASNRAYAKVPVEGGKTYSINLQHSGNFSFWAYEENGVEYGISKLSSYTTNYVATAPSNATILYLCNSGWTSSTGLVVMETDISILGANINDYPFNVTARVEADKLTDLNDLADIVGITKYSKWERGSLNTSAGNLLPTKDTSSAFMLQRICTPISEPISLHLGDVLSINGNRDITYIAFRYNSESSSWVVTSWMTADYVVPVDGNYWVIIRNTDNSGITYITDLSEPFTISRKSGIINSKIKGISNDIPSYYFENNYLRDKLSVIKQKSDILNGVGFVFVTDLHWEVNQGQSKKLIEYIRGNSTVDTVICGGDFARAYGTTVQLRSDYDSTLEYMNYLGKECFYGVRGNHDFHTKASAGASEFDGYTWAKTYNAIYRNSERNVVNALPQHGAYCIDNEAQKTRFICLNSSDWNLTYDKVEEGVPYISVDQVRWFISQLLEKTDWRIVVISHIPSAESLSSNYSSQSIIQDILEAFATKTNFSTTYKSTSISGDFTSTTNKLICHISGHEHHDGYSSESGVLSIVTTCDALYQDDGYGGVAGTITEQAFDVFFFDYDQGTIYAVRIGRGVNRSWSIPS